MANEPASPVLGSAVAPAQPAAPAAAPVVPGSPPQDSPVAITYDMLLQHIPEPIREEAVFKNINKEMPIADLAGQFLNAQKLIGVNRLPAPKGDWTPEQWSGFWKAGGMPETIDGYPVPEKGTLPIDDKVLGDFKALAHKNGLSKAQFEQVLKFHNEYYGSALEKQQTQSKEQLAAGLVPLQQEWGSEYDARLQVADRYLATVVDPQLREALAGNEALLNNPALIKHFYTLAKDVEEAAVRVGDSTNPAIIRSAEQAKAALQKFESDNSELLMSRGNLTPAQKTKLEEEVLPRRLELYKLAYPE